jgi:hypothetical protein
MGDLLGHPFGEEKGWQKTGGVLCNDRKCDNVKGAAMSPKRMLKSNRRATMRRMKGWRRVIELLKMSLSLALTEIVTFRSRGYMTTYTSQFLPVIPLG